MAVIGKIRQRSGLVIGLIALSLLAFILTDAFSSNSSLFKNTEYVVGKMGGSKIKYEEFDQKVRQFEENYRKQYGDLSPDLQNMIRDQVWEGFIKEKVLDKQYQNMHISVSPEELTWVEFKAPEPHQRMVSYFTNPQEGQVFEQFRSPMGDLDMSKALAYRQQLEEGSEQEVQWIDYVDKGIMEELESDKYFTYVRKGSYTTTLEAKQEFAATNNNLKGQVVKLDFFTIQDSTIKVTDAELSEYLQKHTESFQQEASRKLDYVVFDITASADDSAKAKQWAIDKAEQLKTATNDSIYVVNNGGSYDTIFKRRGMFAEDIEDALFDAEKGAVVGPSYKNGKYSVFKVLDSKSDTVQYYRAAHILIRPEGITKEDTTNARNRANTILAEIRGGKSFEESVKEHSLDPTTNAKGGDLGWFEKKAFNMPQSLIDAIVRGNKGDYTVVVSGQGVHIVKITHSPSSKLVKVAEINREIEPGNETLKEISSRANEFAGSVSNEEQFNQQIEKMGLGKRFADKVGQNDRTISGINDARKIVLWAYDDKRKQGDISEPLDANGNTKILIVRLAGIKEKGTAKVEDVREKLEEEVRKEKKAQQLRQKMEEAMKGATNMQQIADKLSVQVLDIPYQTYSANNVTSVGMEPRLLGYLFAAEKNKITGPVKGQSGVFAFTVENVEEAKLPEKMDETKQRMESQSAGSSDMRANDALRKIANIEDMRYKFY